MKPSIPQGTRDFNATTLRKRYYIFETIKKVFELYGFEPLETPAFENLETLMGKYGEEGDKLIFKILNNGLDNPNKSDGIKAAFEKVLSGKNTRDLTERALRYDLTIPFARYVAMNHAQLNMPFKRYQMQPVWRADRPQKGRYREFYQCDADIVGSASLFNDAELTNIYENVFNLLKIPVTIKINSRKILAALARLCGGSEKMMDITMAIDKLDKIGLEKVKEELGSRGLTKSEIISIENYLNINGNNEEVIQKVKNLFHEDAEAMEGIKEVEFIRSKSNDNVTVDLTLARGLNYYTGIILEVKANNVQMGSIGGGGRYDDLTGLFGLKGIPGVGISFGVDRIFDVMEELSLFPESVHKGITALFFNLGVKEADFAYACVKDLRKKGLKCELYPDNTKMDKQFKYATRKEIAYAVIIGEIELSQKECLVKHLNSGKQEKIPITELGNYFLKIDI